MVCILLATLRMLTRRRFPSLATAGLLGALCQPAPAIAQDDSMRAPHVRPEKGLRALVDEAARRAPSIRALIDRLESSVADTLRVEVDLAPPETAQDAQA